MDEVLVARMQCGVGWGGRMEGRMECSSADLGLINRDRDGWGADVTWVQVGVEEWWSG